MQNSRVIRYLWEAVLTITGYQAWQVFVSMNNRLNIGWRVAWIAKITHGWVSIKKSKSKTEKLLSVSTVNSPNIPAKNFKNSMSLNKKSQSDSLTPKSQNDPVDPLTIVPFTVTIPQGHLSSQDAREIRTPAVWNLHQEWTLATHQRKNRAIIAF